MQNQQEFKLTDFPEYFVEKMESILPEEEVKDFLDSYNKRPSKGIRANRLKTTREKLKKDLPEEFEAQDIPWVEEGIYINPDSRPGKIPEYYTGLFYPQEPSAMTSAAALDVEEGDLILDLCAAPGGKSTQLASKLGESGALVLNEIMKGRVPVLASNVERMGIKNAVILNERPERLVNNFYEAFDKILVDAPCSGEGMFRKDPDVMQEWHVGRPELCSIKQNKILETVDQLLKPGGELVYSTCTFSPEENEKVIDELLKTGRYEILPIELDGIETHGLKDQMSEEGLEENLLRIWPHKTEGEGHFVAKLKKLGTPRKNRRRNNNRNKLIRRAPKKLITDYNDFKAEYMPDIKDKHLFIFKDKRLLIMPELLEPNDLEGLKVNRGGLIIGELKKNRFEPSHSLAMALKKDEFNNTYDLDEDELWSYLKGEIITPKEKVRDGWVLMCYNDHPVGFGKHSSNTIKNKYPKGLRIYKK